MDVEPEFWNRADVVAALQARNMGAFLALFSRYSGASQTRIGIAIGMAQGQISEIVNGLRKVEKLEVFDRIATGLGFPDAARMHLGLAPNERATTSAAPGAAMTFDRRPTAGAYTSDVLRPRRMVDKAAGIPVTAIFDKAPTPRDRFAAFAEALTRYAPASKATAVHDLPRLAKHVTAARRRHQACEYTSVIRDLPQLLGVLETAIGTSDGTAKFRASVLASEAYHVAAGLLLKHGDHGLAWLAADRSMRAAERSGDPLSVASAARIVTHALLSGGHLTQAVTFARTVAARLHSVAFGDLTPPALSVYGALLLRGAIAAGRQNDRASALQLVVEAEEAARRLGGDHNYRWTAFGPTNVRLHQVNLAVALGDAGTAIDHARRVDLSKVIVTERKAAFFVDVARAYGQWSKYDRALRALHAAEQAAPEEVTGRPAVRALVTDLASRAPRTVHAEFRALAERIGAVA